MVSTPDFGSQGSVWNPAGGRQYYWHDSTTTLHRAFILLPSIYFVEPICRDTKGPSYIVI